MRRALRRAFCSWWLCFWSRSRPLSDSKSPVQFPTFAVLGPKARSGHTDATLYPQYPRWPTVDCSHSGLRVRNPGTLLARTSSRQRVRAHTTALRLWPFRAMCTPSSRTLRAVSRTRSLAPSSWLLGSVVNRLIHRPVFLCSLAPSSWLLGSVVNRLIHRPVFLCSSAPSLF